MRPLHFQQEEGLETVLPFGVRSIETVRTAITRHVSALTPFYCQNFYGTQGLVYGIHHKTRELIRIDRTNLRPNGHAWILATSGGGKSFSAKWELTQTACATDDAIVILDPNGEYGEIVDALGGVTVQIKPSSKNYINPLEVSTEWDKETGNPTVHKSDYLMTACSLLLGAHHQGDGYYRSIIDRCCRILYQDFGTDDFTMPTLKDFYRILKEQPQEEAEELALMLEVYTEGSLDVFAHASTVQTTNRIVCYDLSEIPNNLKLFALVTVLDALERTVLTNYKNQKNTRIYIDEAHLYFNDEYVGEFLQGATKMYRKWGGIFTCITQNVAECMESTTASLMISNAEMLYLLKQAPKDTAVLKQLLDMSEEEANYIQNANIGECYIRIGGVLVPVNNKLTPPPNLLYLLSTTPAEREKAKAKMKRGEQT